MKTFNGFTITGKEFERYKAFFRFKKVPGTEIGPRLHACQIAFGLADTDLMEIAGWGRPRYDAILNNEKGTVEGDEFYVIAKRLGIDAGYFTGITHFDGSQIKKGVAQRGPHPFFIKGDAEMGALLLSLANKNTAELAKGLGLGRADVERVVRGASPVGLWNVRSYLSDMKQSSKIADADSFAALWRLVEHLNDPLWNRSRMNARVKEVDPRVVEEYERKYNGTPGIAPNSRAGPVSLPLRKEPIAAPHRSNGASHVPVPAGPVSRPEKLPITSQEDTVMEASTKTSISDVSSHRLASIVRAVTQRIGWKDIDIARAMGRTGSTAILIENGNMRVNEDLIVGIASVLRVSVDFLKRATLPTEEEIREELERNGVTGTVPRPERSPISPSRALVVVPTRDQQEIDVKALVKRIMEDQAIAQKIQGLTEAIKKFGPDDAAIVRIVVDYALSS